MNVLPDLLPDPLSIYHGVNSSKNQARRALDFRFVQRLPVTKKSVASFTCRIIMAK